MGSSDLWPFLFFCSEEKMLDIQTQLLEAQDIRFGPIDHEVHPAIESKWTHDAEYMRLMDFYPARPLSPAMVKKQYESIEKKMDEDKNLFYFTIRARADDRLIGKAMLEWINWTNGNGWIWLGIGEAESRRKGYGSQALTMLLRYAFAELSLFRVSAALAAIIFVVSLLLWYWKYTWFTGAVFFALVFVVGEAAGAILSAVGRIEKKLGAQQISPDDRR